MRDKHCCQLVRLGDKSTPEALAKWAEEMAPAWEETAKIVREAHERLERNKQRAANPRAVHAIIEPEYLT